MKQCPYCGHALDDDAKFCGECGNALPEEGAAIPQASADAASEPIPPTAPAEPVAVPVAPEAPQAAPAPDMPVVTQVPSRKQMLSTFQYILLSMLYAIPVVGLIFLFVFGAGHPKNVSLKRFSAAMLILRLVFWIVLLALLIVAMIKNGRLLSDALGQLIPAVERLIEALFA